MTEYVKKITPEKKEAILQNSVMSMPNAAVGNPAELKKAFVNPIINADGNACLADEIDRIAQETNEAFDNTITKEGGTFTGNVSVVKENRSVTLSVENNEKPFIELNSVNGKTQYFENGIVRDRKVLAFPDKSGVLAVTEDVNLVQNQINALRYGNHIVLSVNPDTYLLTVSLYQTTDSGAKLLSNASVDLPLEGMVVGGSFDDGTDSVVLTLKNGQEVKFSVSQLINGLVSSADFQAFVSQKGQANGFPSLDENGKVPKGQLPSDIGGSVDGVNLEELKKVFVEKPTNTTGFNRAYGVLNGSTTTTYYDVMTPTQFNSEANAKRRAGLAYYTNGRLGCAYPEGDYEAANKKFVEDAIAKNGGISEIYEILDLAGVTETVEIESTYDIRQSGVFNVDASLKVIPNTPTIVKRVNGASVTAKNMLDVTKLQSSDIPVDFLIADNGYTITIASTEDADSRLMTIGKFSELVPTAKIGDVLYFYASGTGLYSNSMLLGDTMRPVTATLDGKTPLTVTKSVLDSDIYATLVISASSNKKISEFYIGKEPYDRAALAQFWQPNFSGLKAAKFAGVVALGKNICNNTSVEWDIRWSEMSSADYATSSLIELPTDNSVYSLSIFDKNGVPLSLKSTSVYCFDKNSERIFPNNSIATVYGGAFKPFVGTKYVKFQVTFLTEGISIGNTQLEIGSTQTEFEPYITPSELSFPEIEMPLGRVLDFENKKVLDYGVDIVFKGDESRVQVVTENINSESNVHSMFFDLMSISINDYDTNRDSYICTDTTEFIDMRAHIWHGLADSIGITAAGESLTQEQLDLATINLKAWLAERYQNGNPVTIRYISSKLQSSRDMTAEEIAAWNTYMPIVGGIEYQSGNSAAAYGANNTVTQEYDMYRKLGGDN